MEQSEIQPRRKALGLSVTALADYLGMSQQYLSQLEQKAISGNPSTRNASASKLEEIDGVLSKLESIAAMAARMLPVVPKKPRLKKQA